jgi:hypothetical protein
LLRSLATAEQRAASSMLHYLRRCVWLVQALASTT